MSRNRARRKHQTRPSRETNRESDPKTNVYGGDRLSSVNAESRHSALYIQNLLRVHSENFRDWTLSPIVHCWRSGDRDRPRHLLSLFEAHTRRAHRSLWLSWCCGRLQPKHEPCFDGQ